MPRSDTEYAVSIMTDTNGQLNIVEPGPIEGVLTAELQNGTPVLHWSGTDRFQLQMSYDLITWYNEGSCRKGPAIMYVTPRVNGGPQYFRVVPCEEQPIENP